MKLKFKVFTSFVLTITFLVSVLSGLAMYLGPKGRIANWIEWTWLGFTKEEWTAIHTVFVTVFLLAGIFHLFYFNWKVFWAYIKQRAKKGIRYKWELVISAVLGLILWFGTVYEVKPVISVVLLAESIDASFENKLNEPPVPHAEELTIAEFAEKVLKKEIESVLKALEKENYIAAGPDELLGDLAERYSVPPSKIYAALEAKKTVSIEISEYSGYGQKTFAEVCVDAEVKIATGRKRLGDAGIPEFDLDDTLRTIADRYGKEPIDLVKVIAGEEG